jgi:hypothetical protein
MTIFGMILHFFQFESPTLSLVKKIQKTNILTLISRSICTELATSFHTRIHRKSMFVFSPIYEITRKR